MIEVQESTERALQQAVSRALCDNLGPLQRTASDLEQALGEFMAACSSAKPSDALPAMLRAQAFAASLSASLSVLSNFTAIALNQGNGVAPARQPEAAPVRSPEPAVAPESAGQRQQAPAESVAQPSPQVAQVQASAVHEPEPVQAHHAPQAAQEMELELTPEPTPAPEAAASQYAAPVQQQSPEPAAATAPAFDIASFPADIQELHRRANRVAKVAMQDIKLLRPQDVQLGREHKDICERLRSDIDKARKEYDRRFRAIQDHPVDYFHRWMVEILAEGREEALGEYPYPSPVLRH